ncbi:MAG TPA: LuxR C-terminal-related transcriptional regulator [Anaerolineales bacterium]|nr:LuxR C-terminal-related transcriptional regulator [Anaerolineales bacterium]
MNEALARKLTLISAPAGFGKTTLLSEWIETLRSRRAPSPPQQCCISWISLDEGDQEPSLFFSYLVTALRQHEATSTVGQTALGMLLSPQPAPAEAVLTALINDVASTPATMVLVLDDFHSVESQPICDGLAFLLERQPPHLHLVVSTRKDPILPLASLRAKNQLVELRAADLRFTTGEAGVFLHQVMGLELSDENVTALQTRTEGWIAGLQLAAISMQGKEDTETLIETFTGSHRYVLDYLLEEVLQRQSDATRDFLISTCILGRLHGALCDALTGRDDGQQTLEDLDRANLFVVSLDDDRRWYRYHHLFAEMLRQQLHRTHPEQVPSLHRLAAEWFERHGYVDEAIEHALRAEDFEWAAVLIQGRVDDLWGRGEHITLRSWMNSLPDESVLSNPHLAIYRAWNLFSSGQQAAAEEVLQTIEATLDTDGRRVHRAIPGDQGPPLEFDRRKIKGMAATIRALSAFYRGDVEVAKTHALLALDALPEEEANWRTTATISLGDAYAISGELSAAYRYRNSAVEASKGTGSIYMTLAASMRLAATLRMQGKLSEAIDLCESQSRILEDAGLSQIAEQGFLLAIWGDVLAEWNDLDAALRHANLAREQTVRVRDVGTIGWSYLVLIRILFSMGHLAKAQDLIHELETATRGLDVPDWILYRKAAWQVRIWLAGNKLDRAERWAIDSGLDFDGALTYQNEREFIALSRILVAQRRPAEALRLLQRLLLATEASGHVSRGIEILILQALAYNEAGDKAQAVSALEHGLRLAQPGGFIRLFVDEGPPIQALLKAVDGSGQGLKGYIRKLLAAFAAGGDRPTRDQSMIERLSDRELEVLRLIAEGLTNREIADRLYLAINTVKVHNRTIFGKLGASHRTEAVARARVLGLLPGT